MKFITKPFLIIITGCTLLLLGACNTSTIEQNPSPVSNSSSYSTSTSNTSDATFDVKAAQVNVKGKSELVLTDSRGFTLYTFKPDTTTKTACTGPCAKTWPPLLAKQVGQTTFDHIGTLSAVQDANGIQVQADSHFLYTFSKDTAPGQANGEGVAGKWFVATPTNA
jgi:predicted lipoprotein with Yx(FWY)xxD motif